MRAVRDNIIGEVIPPEHKVGEIYLPPSRETHTMVQGDCLELRVVEVGPEVYDVKPGMIVMVDPNPVAREGRFFTHEGVEYACVPEVYFDWKEAKGFLFGAYKEEDDG